ncbi:hypothetical protein SAMN02910369_02299 [Lachnospiraceae bacterium NE2001]|nr:hypothetical protein SAMN02910369_02299 [Lachnospiraceae bacterium NE2001]
MSRDDSILYSFRLNINNPEHLKLHKILRDLDTSIYKSKSNFIIEILKNYLLYGENSNLFCYDEVAEQGGYVTKEYVDNLKASIREELEVEIKQELFNMVITAMTGVGRAGKIDYANPDDKSELSKTNDETDKLMKELNNMWS